MAILIRGGLVVTLDEENRIFEDGEILVEGDEITAVGTRGETESGLSTEVIDANDMIAIPGLVNAHSHSYGALLKGRRRRNLPLDLAIVYAFAGGERRTPREIYISAAVDCIEMLRTGTTTVLDHFSQRPAQTLEGIDAGVQAYLDAGLRVTLAPHYYDRHFDQTVPLEVNRLPAGMIERLRRNQVPPADETLEVCRAAIHKWQGVQGRVQIMLGPSGPLRCSDRLLRGTSCLAEETGVGIHIHVLQAKTEMLKGQQEYGCPIMEHLDALGLLTKRTCLVHFRWITKADIRLAADRGAHAVYCPTVTQNGTLPLYRLREGGVNVALGTDEATNSHLSMFERMKLAALLDRTFQPDFRRWQPVQEILAMATKGGARTLGLEEKLGSLKPGYKADIVLLDGKNSFWRPRGDPHFHLVHLENGSSVRTALVAGEVVLRDGRLTRLNEEDILGEAQDISDRIQRDNTGDYLVAEELEPYLREMYFEVMRRDIGMDRFVVPLEGRP